MPYLDKDGLDALWTKIKANFGHTLSKTSSSTAVNIALKTTSNGTLNSVDINKSDITALGIPAADTHYTSKNVAGGTSSATANAAASNGSVYLNSVENGAVTSANLIKGTGATTVTSAADGTITVNSTDTKYTLPTASASTLGGVKVGTNLSISSSGVLSAASGTDEKVKSSYVSLSDDDMFYLVGASSKLTEETGTLKKSGIAFHTSEGLIVGDQYMTGNITLNQSNNAANSGTITFCDTTGSTLGTLTATDYTGKAAEAAIADNVAWSGVTGKPSWIGSSKPEYNDGEIKTASSEAKAMGATYTSTAIDLLFDNKAPLASPTFTGTPCAPTAAEGTSSTQIATTAFVSNAIASEAVGHAKYQGGITPTTYAALKSYKQGWYWVVTTAGTIAGESCEIGDMVFCNTDSASGATAPTASHFDVVQNNIDAIEISYIENLS